MWYGRARRPANVTAAKTRTSAAASSIRSVKDGAQYLLAARAAALAQQQDPQHLATARRQDGLAHVADDRHSIGVGSLVVDLGAAQDRVPAPAAHCGNQRVEKQRRG